MKASKVEGKIMMFEESKINYYSFISSIYKIKKKGLNVYFWTCKWALKGIGLSLFF